MMIQMKSLQIRKLYISNFLTGLVFWYGIEKLFMQSIGISAVGIGVAAAALTLFSVIFNIPAGILADKWSRKGVLVVSVLALAAASLVEGESHSLEVYITGVLLYGIYIVTSNGTYQAIIFDSLREEGRAEEYSKINGRIYAFFLLGAGLGDALSGFIAHKYGYRASFLGTIIPCLLNAGVILTLHEPALHKPINKEKIFPQLGRAIIAVSKIKLVKALTVVMSLFAITELFKLEFGQLYMFRYVTAVQAIGILWAIFSFSMALGSMVAHRFRSRLSTLIVCSVLPLVLMSFTDNQFSILLFMIQAIAAAALFNQIETRIQENTPSHIRASVLSVVSTLGRTVAVPASFVLGWLFRDFDALVALRFIAILATITLIYWLIITRNIPKADVSIASS